MKKQAIRAAFTQKVAELLAQGYTLFPDTMAGHQGEIAKVDLSNGSEIVRVLLTRSTRYGRDEDGYWGDTVVLTVGKAGEDTRIFPGWTDSTIWNNRLEVRSQIEWADIGEGWRRGKEWFTTLEEGKRIMKIRHARYTAQDRPIREELGGAYKSAALKWLRRQPRMKSCKLEDIEKFERVWLGDGTRRFEIRAKGRSFTLGR